MTEPVQITLISAIPAGIAALVGVGTMIITLRNRAIQVETHGETSLKLDHITVLTNSTLATALARIAAMEKQIETLNAALVFFDPNLKAAAAAAAAAAESTAAEVNKAAAKAIRQILPNP